MWLHLLHRGCCNQGYLQGIWEHLEILPLYQPQPRYILADALAHKNGILWQVLPQCADSSGQWPPLRLHLLRSEPAYKHHLGHSNTIFGYAMVQKCAGWDCLTLNYGL